MLKDIAPAIKALGDGTGKGVLVVDDLTDTGKTAKIVRDMLPNAHFAAVYAKPAGRPLIDTFVTEVSQDTWIYFPWDMGLAYQAPIREGLGRLDDPIRGGARGGIRYRADAQDPVRGASRRPGPFGRNKVALEDPERQPITFGRLVLGSLVLGRKLAGLTRSARHVGVLLPNVQAIAVTLFGLNAFGRVPAFLNFTAGLKNLKAACELAEIEDHRHLPPLRRAGQARRCRRRRWARGGGSSGSRTSARDLTSFDKLRGLSRVLVRAARPRRGRSSSPTIRPCCCSPRDRRACRRAWCCRTPISSPMPIR